MSSGLQKRHSLVLSLLGAGLVWVGPGPALAGEKANITAPSARKTPENLEPPKKTLPFRPLDGSSSIGGVVDGGGTPDLPSVEPSAPSPRAQKEMMERLDRKRNFLLNDPSSDSNLDNNRLGGSLDQKDQDELHVSPRKPKTALERQLNRGNNTIRDQKASTQVNTQNGEEDRSESDNESDSRNSSLSGLGFNSRSRIDKGLSGEFLAPHPTEKGIQLGTPSETTVDSGRLEDLRSTLSGNSARNSGLDSLSRERLERFQQLSGDGETLRRGFGTDPVEFGQGRQLRSDAAQSFYSSSSPEKPATKSLGGNTLEPPPADALAARSNPLLAAPSVGGFTAIAPPTPSSPPQASPAAILLRQPRPEPPRFRQ